MPSDSLLCLAKLSKLIITPSLFYKAHFFTGLLYSQLVIVPALPVRFFFLDTSLSENAI